MTKKHGTNVKYKTPYNVDMGLKARETVNEERRNQGLPELSKELLQINPPLTPEQEAKIPPIYLDMLVCEKRIVTEQWAIRVAKEMLTWVHSNPESIKVNEFLAAKGIMRADFDRLAERYKILKDVYAYTVEYLGIARERKMLTGEWQAGPAMFMMRHYDSDWKREIELREEAKIKQNKFSQDEVNATIALALKPTPHTEEVARSLLEKGNDGSITPTTTDISSQD